MCKDRLRDSSLWLLILALALIAFKLVVVDRVPTPFRRPRLRADDTLPGVEQPLDQPFADGLALIGYDQSREQIPADALLRVDLYWTVRRQPTRRYQTVIHLVGPDGLRWSRADTFRPRRYQDPPPTTAWTPGRYALDSHEIEPLPGTPPGTYDLVLTVFDRKTLKPLSALNEQGQPAAPELTLGQVTLSPPRHPTAPEECSIRNRLDAPLGPLTLLGADFDRDEAAPGDPVFITTFWQANRAREQGSKGAEEHNLTAHLDLLAPDGSTAAEYEFPPVASWHPISTWRPGDVWRGQHLVHLPADLDTAAYTWTLSLAPSPPLPLSLSQLSVTAPDRTFIRPPVDIETNTRLGDLATLVGANLQPATSNLKPEATFTTTLVWRADAETDISYRVFLHLIGPEGNLVTQSDGIPAGWTRPTTSWLAGEYVTDTHTLDVPTDAPAGEYTLQAGLYNPGGERLKTPDGTAAIPLATLEVPSP
jgi:hypothetical protein